MVFLKLQGSIIFFYIDCYIYLSATHVHINPNGIIKVPLNDRAICELKDPALIAELSHMIRLIKRAGIPINSICCDGADLRLLVPEKGNVKATAYK